MFVEKDVIALNCGVDCGSVKAYKRKEVVGVGAKRCHCS